jgi:hypothetical protein
MRAVLATTIIWIASRGAFWIGCHRGSQSCTIGLTGTAQNMVVLLSVCARFGFDAAGPAGAIVPLAAFRLIEVYPVTVHDEQDQI